MLIYDHNKTLVGMSQEILAHLNYISIDAFLKEHKDVAEMFVKKPGYVHNFKNFSWIDFIKHTESDDAHAIIETESKSLSCELTVEPFFLTSSPEEEGYIVKLKNVKNLSSTDTPLEINTTKDLNITEDVDLKSSIMLDSDEPTDLSLNSVADIEETVLKEPDTFDIPDTFETSIDDFVIQDDLNLAQDIDLNSEETPMLGDYINQDLSEIELDTDSNYKFDPKVASGELGLPVELINEFIGDFIKQAHEFRPQLQDATLKENYDEVHVLSHKLKGVAANLRIEDAFEVLNVVNSSVDQDEIESYLAKLDSIIAKMEGKSAEPQSSPKVHRKEEEQIDLGLEDEDDDIYNLDSLINSSDYSKPEERLLKPSTSLNDNIEPLGEIWLEDINTDDIKILDEDLLIDDEFETLTQESDMHDKSIFDNEDLDRPTLNTLNYNAKKASQELGVSKEFVESLTKDFKIEALERREELIKAIKDEDFLHIKRIVFPFKGLADNLRITQISDSIGKLITHGSKEAAQQESEKFYELLKQL